MTDGSTPDRRMSLGEHLEELRQRIIYSLIGVAVGAAGCLIIGKVLVKVLYRPLRSALATSGLDVRINTFAPTEPFMIYLKVSLVAGLIITSPWVLYQIWQFISIGMYKTEQRVVHVLAPFSAGMTTIGVAFMYFVMLPICLWFFISFGASFPSPGEHEPSWLHQLLDGPSQVETTTPKFIADNKQITQPAWPLLREAPTNPKEGQIWIKVPEYQIHTYFGGHIHTITTTSQSASLIRPVIGLGRYISFVVVLAIGIVVAFQLPVIMFVLGWTQLVDPSWLAHYRRHCIFACFALGMILTPSDPYSMIILALPLWGLYELGLVLMRSVYKPSA